MRGRPARQRIKQETKLLFSLLLRDPDGLEDFQLHLRSVIPQAAACIVARVCEASSRRFAMHAHAAGSL